MGNACECVRRQTSDEAEDALLSTLVGEVTDGRPRGPPPPYQVCVWECTVISGNVSECSFTTLTGTYTVTVSLSLYTLTVLTVAAFSVRFVVHCTFRFGNS